ncbi:MAG: hypothetical protein NTX35_12010 [Verrucomicrobia bacterium]|nr:hypothetical protein [Verrucomicrobiota bacterium]
MRYFFENLFTLHPQNLIPEAVWLGVGLYCLVLLACFQSILTFMNLRKIAKLVWSLIVLLPFIGPVFYASYRLFNSESTLKEVLQSRNKNVQ